jgi:multicomponent Na+:H+ antiporter subunit D
MTSAFPPGLLLIAGAAALPFVRGHLRTAVLMLVPALTLWFVWQVPDGAGVTLHFLGFTLEPVKADALSRLFATVFCIMAFAAAVYALNQDNVVELSAAFAYAGGAVGVTLSGDLISLFVFWELMAIFSTVVVWCGGTARSYRSGMRYALMHLFGGVLLMSGIVAYAAQTGSVAFVSMTALLDRGSPAAWLILGGFLINAGAPPLSAWLPDAYPEASWSGTVVLSAFTTKSAVYALLRGYPGAEILIWVGLYMVFYGIVYGLLENDIRRILSYSIVNQVGFMVTGAGIGTSMALNGAAAHAFAHIIYKALLLMAAGSVIYRTGKRRCSDLGGLFRTMPLTCGCAIVGALSISAFPFTSGFISKSMVAQGAADRGMAVVWFLLMAGSAGVFLDIAMKWVWFIFFQKDSGLRPPDPPWNMRAAMVFFAFLCVGMGLFPSTLYSLLPFPVDYQPYSVSHVLTKSQLLLFAGFAFVLMLPYLKRTLTICLDVDWFWRRFGRAVGKEFALRGKAFSGMFSAFTYRRVERFIERVARHHGPQGVLARTWPTGSTVIWVAVLLAAYLVFYYV